MVLTLKGSSSLPVLQEKDAKQWFDWFRSDRINKSPPPRNLRLDYFLKMKIFCHSQKFVPRGTQDNSIEELNDFRNKFIHFTPKGWSIELKWLLDVTLDCLEIAEFLAWESGNVRLCLYQHG